MHDTLDLGGRGWVTDGGLETDVIFTRGVDLPHFAAFPLVDDAAGRALLEDYYAAYVAVATAAGAGLVLETPTWRASPDWAERLGYDAAALDRSNQRAVDLVRSVLARADVPGRLVSGAVGPRGDGYVAGGVDADEAAEYHAVQVRSFAAAGADVVHAMTLNEPAEAVGVVRAARAEGLTVAISFTVETDGRLPDGTPLRDAIEQVDAVTGAGPAWYGVNCAHPEHVAPALEDGPDEDGWRARVASFRPNASTLTHEELDAMTELDSGDLPRLVRSTEAVRRGLPALQVVGGCCGTDARHVAALWGVPAPATS